MKAAAFLVIFFDPAKQTWKVEKHTVSANDEAATDFDTFEEYYDYARRDALDELEQSFIRGITVPYNQAAQLHETLTEMLGETGENIHLSELASVSNNSPATQSVLQAVNSRFNVRQKRDFQLFLRIIKNRP